MATSRALLEVIEPGLLTTVQDAGRASGRALGVPVSGAADGLALAAANLLCGNPPDAAALELSLLGARLRVVERCVIGYAGADMDALVEPDGMPLRPGVAAVVSAGSVLAF